MTWNEEELAFIKALWENENSLSWMDVADQVGAKFKKEANPEAVRSAYRRWRDVGFTGADETTLNRVKQARSAQKRSSHNARTLRLLLDAREDEQLVLERIKEIVAKVGKVKTPKPPKKYPNRFPMVMELLLSDLHFGKLVKEDNEPCFNEKIARNRLKQVTSVFLKELHMAQKHYNVERIVVALLGDMIESFEMHNIESARGCEYGTAKQIWACIDALLFEVFLPLAETGIHIDVPAVTGNHDRSERKRTYENPGENNWTYIIYKTLESMLVGRGYKNVKFIIPASPYCTLDIFGYTVLYEHFDNVRGASRESFDKLMRKRGRQLGRMVDMMRGGHFHEYNMYGNGEVIVNGSLSGSDSFADVIGYKSEPCQVLNYYLDIPGKVGKKKKFHKTFGIELE